MNQSHYQVITTQQLAYSHYLLAQGQRLLELNYLFVLRTKIQHYLYQLLAYQSYLLFHMQQLSE